MNSKILPGTVALTMLVVLGACNGDRSPPADSSRRPQETPTTAENAVTDLMIEDLTEGTGAAISGGQTASVHYTGWLFAPDAPEHKGKQFDSSRGRGQPFSFPVGGGRVIAGWDQGVVGMKVGGERRLIIPASLGYGAEGAGGGVIPPGATLVFDVELLAIR